MTMYSCDESDHDLISMDMLEEVGEGSQYHPNVYGREAKYKIRYHIRQRQSEWKGVLKSTQNMGECLHKIFKTAIKYILQDFTIFGRIWFRSFPFYSRTYNLC